MELTEVLNRELGSSGRAFAGVNDATVLVVELGDPCFAVDLKFGDVATVVVFDDFVAREVGLKTAVLIASIEQVVGPELVGRGFDEDAHAAHLRTR